MSCRSSLSFIGRLSDRSRIHVTLPAVRPPPGQPSTSQPSAGQPSTGLICVLGDAHLDVVVSIDGVPAADTDTPARTRLAVGGQAANVAAWVVALGGRSRLIAARATDLAAGLVSGELARRGVQFVGPVIEGRTGVIVALSDGGSQRTMLTDRGVGPMLAAAD